MNTNQNTYMFAVVLLTAGKRVLYFNEDDDVASEFIRSLNWHPSSHTFHHYRTVDGIPSGEDFHGGIIDLRATDEVNHSTVLEAISPCLIAFSSAQPLILT